MKKKYFSLAVVCMSWLGTQAQSPAGDAYFIDYDLFQQDNVVHFITAPGDASTMPTDELTTECWIKIQNSAWNQKIMGRLTSTFNNGYMMGIDQGKIYPEIWTPSQSQLLDGFVPPVPEPYYWIHLAATWKQGGRYIGYINGVEVANEAASSGAVAGNNADFVLGIAPWDLSNFQTFGKIDEVRVWTVERTAEEIKEYMYKNLAGNETGLGLYYDFDGATGTTVSDQTSNGNDGTVNNPTGNDFAPSEAVLGNSTAQTMEELNGLWNAIGFMDPRFVTTDHGLSLTASNIPENDYIVFGHNGGSGLSSDDSPAMAPADFMRTDRLWYIDEEGAIDATLIFNLTEAAGGGTELDGAQATGNYTLLWRSGTSGAFTPVAAASSFNNGVAQFANESVSTGYYAIGVGSAPVGNVGVNENEFALEVNLYPNPTRGQFTLNFTPTADQFSIEIINVTGQVIEVMDNTSGFNGTAQFDLSEQPAGLYLVRITDGNRQTVRQVELAK